MAYSHVTTRSRVHAKPIETKTQAMIGTASRDHQLHTVTNDSTSVAQITDETPATLTLRDHDLHRDGRQFRSQRKLSSPRARSGISVIC